MFDGSFPGRSWAGCHDIQFGVAVREKIVRDNETGCGQFRIRNSSLSFDLHAYSVVKVRYCFWSSRRIYNMDALNSVGSNVLAGVVPEYQLTGSSTCSPHSVHHQSIFYRDARLVSCQTMLRSYQSGKLLGS